MPFHQTKKDVKIEIDYTVNQEVSVITVFNTEGKIKPLYVSITDIRGNVYKAEIINVKDVKEELGYINYFCTYALGDRLRECLLIYYIQTHTWVLKKH